MDISKEIVQNSIYSVTWNKIKFYAIVIFVLKETVYISKVNINIVQLVERNDSYNDYL